MGDTQPASQHDNPVNTLAAALNFDETELQKGISEEIIGHTVGRLLGNIATLPAGGAAATVAEKLAEHGVEPVVHKLHHPYSDNSRIRGTATGGHLYTIRGEDGKPHDYRAAMVGGTKEHGGVTFVHEPKPGEPHMRAQYISHKEFIDRIGRGEIQDAEPGKGTRKEWWHGENGEARAPKGAVIPGKGKTKVLPKGVKIARSEEPDVDAEGESLEKSADLVQHLAYHLATNGPAIAAQVQDAVHHLAAAHIGETAAHLAAHVGREGLATAQEHVKEAIQPAHMAQVAGEGGAANLAAHGVKRAGGAIREAVASKMHHEPYHVETHDTKYAKTGHDYMIHDEGAPTALRFHAHGTLKEGVHLDPKPYKNDTNKDYEGRFMTHEEFEKGVKSGRIRDNNEEDEKSVTDDVDLVKAEAVQEQEVVTTDEQPREEGFINPEPKADQAEVPVPDRAAYAVRAGDKVTDLRGRDYLAGKIENGQVAIETDGRVVAVVSEPDWNRFVRAPGMTVRRDGRHLPL